MKLRFYAKADHRVTQPGIARIFVGDIPRYVGRGFTQRDGDSPATHPARAEAYECEANSPIGRRLIEVTRRDRTLWAADQVTATACNVPYVETEFRDGEHVPKSTESLEDGRVPKQSSKRGK